MDSANKVKTKKKAPPHAFKKGQSGNPNGRPKKTAQEIDLIQACKDKTEEALQVMLEIMQNGENERNRFSAAQAIMERGHGKPVQPTTGTVDANIRFGWLE